MERGEGDSIVDPSGGANQARVRAYNERLVLSLVRRHDGISKAEIARKCGLTAQTVTVIIRGLERDGLLRRGPRRRGKVGQPSTPMHLDADGALAFGLKIGRRSADLFLMDFAGAVRERRRIHYRWPEPDEAIAFAAREVGALTEALPAASAARVAGLGLAMPFQLWNWERLVGAPEGGMAAWAEVDLATELARVTAMPVRMHNDATAACGAELAFGRGPQFPSYAYVYIDFFAGGGVVLDHALWPGLTGNAGAFGSMPVPRAGGGVATLIDEASLFLLEPPGGGEVAWDGLGPRLDAWIDRAAPALAAAILAAVAVADFDAAILDGAMPADVLDRLRTAVAAALDGMDRSGLGEIRLEAGTLGPAAPATGAALLPLMDRYFLDTRVLFSP